MLNLYYPMIIIRTRFLCNDRVLIDKIAVLSVFTTFTSWTRWVRDLCCFSRPTPLCRKIRPSYSLIIIFLLSLTLVCLSDTNSPDESQADDVANQNNVIERFRFADGLIRRGYFDMAEKEFLQLLTDNHSSNLIPNILFKLGDCLRQADKLDDSVEILSRLKEEFPNHSYSQKAAIIIANICIESGRLEKAESELTSIINATGISEIITESANYYLGVIYNLKSDHEKSIAYFSTLSDKPFSENHVYRPYAVLNLALLYKNLDNFNKSLEYLKRLYNSENIPKSIKEEALFQLAELEKTKGAKENAIFYYDQLLKNYPTSAFATNALAGRAWVLLNLGDYKKLIQLLIEHSRLISENNDELIYLRGLSLKHLNRFKSALTDFIEIVDKFKNSGYRLFSFYYAIDCLYEVDRYDELIVRANSFVEEFPENELAINVLFLQCQALISGNQKADALSLLHRISISYKDELSGNSESLLHLAKLFTSLGKYKEAALVYRNLAAKAGVDHQFQFLMNAAECEILGNDFSEAYDLYQSLLSLDLPKTVAPKVLMKMTEIRIRQKAEKDAIVILDGLIQDYPADKRLGRAQYLRGTLHYYLGNIENAIIDLQYVVSDARIEELEIAKLYLAYSLWIKQRKSESLNLFSDLLRKNKVIEDNLAADLIKEVGYEFIKINHYDDAEKCFLLLQYSSDYVTSLQGELGIAEIEFSKGNFAKSKDLFYKLKQSSRREIDVYGICLSYLGESLVQLNKSDEAFILFEEALNLNFDNSAARSRCRYGIGFIYDKNDDLENALRYAMSVFVLFDNNNYVPSSMILSAKVLYKLNRFTEMNEILSDLAMRYPSHFNEYKSNLKYEYIFDSLVDDKKSITK